MCQNSQEVFNTDNKMRSALPSPADSHPPARSHAQAPGPDPGHSATQIINQLTNQLTNSFILR